MGKRQEAAKQTRENIVLAAKRLHERKGLAGVSVDDIVAEAGVSKGTFYVYFERREDIAYEIAFRDMGAVAESLKNKSGTAAEKVAEFLAESARFIEEGGLELCKQWMKGAVCPAGSDGRGIAKLKLDRDFIYETLAAAEKDGGPSGTLPAEQLADMITAEYYGAVTLWCMTDGRFPMRERLNRFAETVAAMTGTRPEKGGPAG